MITIGFTGTSHGMTDLQKKQLVSLLIFSTEKYFHHGDCIGADREEIHPPIMVGVGEPR